MLTPYSTSIEPFVWWENGFTDQELNWLQKQAVNADQRASVGQGNNSHDELQKIRRSQISWLEKTQECSWVFHKLAHIASSLNAQHYKFDVTGFGEPLQLTNYNYTEHGMYGWHQDIGGRIGPSRKLSMVLQLTDPSDYEGGNLQVQVSSTPINIKKQRGLIALFPSYILHQVTPVTSGCRQSLVAWISGPQFK
jgi:PKHD-type hydroxylase